MALREWGHSTSAELARDICHDAGSLTRILDELEQRDLIARARSETDRRVVSLSMTPSGIDAGRDAAAAGGGTLEYAAGRFQPSGNQASGQAADPPGRGVGRPARRTQSPRGRKRQEKLAGPLARPKGNSARRIVIRRGQSSMKKPLCHFYPLCCCRRAFPSPTTTPQMRLRSHPRAWGFPAIPRHVSRMNGGKRSMTRRSTAWRLCWFCPAIPTLQGAHWRESAPRRRNCPAPAPTTCRK